MARTIAQIQQAMIDAKDADGTLAALNSTSNTAIWLLWTYIVAVCQWVVENLFDAHREEVNKLINGQRAHTLQWYVYKAKAFQYGVALVPETDYYASPAGDPVVLIIKYAAAAELTSLVRLKVATLSGGVLAPLATPELAAFTAYMQLIKDAGVRLQITTGYADTLQLALDIYYDPLVLDAYGGRLDGTSATPVLDAINVFLTELPFNGLFILNSLIARLQAVDGIVIVSVVSAAANYASLPFTPFTVEYLPDAGYLELDAGFMLGAANYYAHG
jgi:hypothetical protein